jgi:endoglucanase Acf2
MQINSSNSRYYYDILKVHGFTKKSGYTAEEEAKIDEILTGYEKNLPKATAHQRIKIALLSGERFKNELIKYSKPLLSKGAPALITDIKADVYGQLNKV